MEGTGAAFTPKSWFLTASPSRTAAPIRRLPSSARRCSSMATARLLLSHDHTYEFRLPAAPHSSAEPPQKPAPCPSANSHAPPSSRSYGAVVATGPWRGHGYMAMMVLLDAAGRVAAPTSIGSKFRIPMALSFLSLLLRIFFPLPALPTRLWKRACARCRWRGEREYLDAGRRWLAAWRIPAAVSFLPSLPRISLMSPIRLCVVQAWCLTLVEREYR